MRQEIAAASGKGDTGFQWAQEVEREGATHESLADSGRFVTLDAKLASALAKIAHGEIGRRITLATEMAAREGRMLKGRQSLLIVYEHFTVSEEAGALYDFEDLMNVRFKGDNHLESFMNTWDTVLASIDKPPAADIVETLFVNQLRNSKDLREEIAHYDRSLKGTRDRTYEFLYLSVKRLLERRRHADNRKAVTLLLTGERVEKTSPSLSAPVHPEKERGKRKAGAHRLPLTSSRACAMSFSAQANAVKRIAHTST